MASYILGPLEDSFASHHMLLHWFLAASCLKPRFLNMILVVAKTRSRLASLWPGQQKSFPTFRLTCTVQHSTVQYSTVVQPQVLPHLPVDGDVEDWVDKTAANSSYLYAVNIEVNVGKCLWPCLLAKKIWTVSFESKQEWQNSRGWFLYSHWK